MKISNYNFTRSLAFCVTFSVLVISLAFLTISEGLISDLALIAIGTTMLFLIFRIQSVSYEISGNCLTIRKFHPFTSKKFNPPCVELPQSSIKNYHLSNYLGLTTLTLRINTHRKKNYLIRIYFFGFSTSQCRKIQSSLQMMKVSG
ncbi:hypothetical protein [Chryseobacterium sp. RR2-3-20]|uniref:hypothetical protein n=1 Tax=Chryseobacterium sp. RR2-3-20 TaxID=2787626 RepID=UPI001AE0007B|nr:hypothetical protein [Chryseobacterium sp. RR2-3-20]